MVADICYIQVLLRNDINKNTRDGDDDSIATKFQVPAAVAAGLLRCAGPWGY